MDFRRTAHERKQLEQEDSGADKVGGPVRFKAIGRQRTFLLVHAEDAGVRDKDIDAIVEYVCSVGNEPMHTRERASVAK
jgi:hypothetical protein